MTWWWVRDWLMTIWEQQGGREVPVGSHVLLPLWSYQGTWARGGPAVTLPTLLMSSPLQSQGLFLFIMRTGGFVGEPVDKPHGGSKIKQHSYSSLRICGGQGSCLEPEAWQKRGRQGELTQDILLIKQPGCPRRDTDTVKRGKHCAYIWNVSTIAPETANSGQKSWKINRRLCCQYFCPPKRDHSL